MFASDSPKKSPDFFKMPITRSK